MKKCSVLTYLILLALIPGLSRAAAGLAQDSASQAPNPGNHSSAQFAVRSSFGSRVAMRDGVHLSVDIYRPEGAGPYPAVLAITPYGKKDSYGDAKRAKGFARRGYVAVFVDSRGRYDSVSLVAIACRVNTKSGSITQCILARDGDKF